VTISDFKLPDLGEGLPDGEIVRWTVHVGDTVKVNDVIAEVETVKAAVELPSPYAGVVTALLAKEGETVPVGTAIISIETNPAGRVGDEVPVSRPADASAELERPLVGYGAVEQSPARRRNGVKRGVRIDSASTVLDSGVVNEHHEVLAKPPVRKLAKDLGVELQDVAGTGPNGTVTRDDIRAASSGRPNGALAVPRPTGDDTRIPVTGIRKRTAAAMVASAFTAPHVSLFKTIDMTATMELRDRVAARREFADLKVSPLLFVAKAVLLAAERTPEVNATWDEANHEIVLHAHVNLGIAAATDRGLIVPNIKSAHEMSLRELAESLAALAQTAREGRATPSDLTGGTITITNVGVFGVDSGTPILNPGESAILAFGSVERRPWVVGSGADERIEARWVTQLCVSFDHRIVDGEQGARFLRDIADVLSDPGLALL
jgi:pyruvate dehydrogenase E2 component (dihydrolipoamide acetyltransferase)